MAEDDDLYWEEQRIEHLNWSNKPDFSMIVIRDSADPLKDDLSVFPPINHENLQVASFIDGDERIRESPSGSSSPLSSSRGSSSSSSFSLSPSDTDGQPPWTASDFDRKSPSQPSVTDGKPAVSPSDLDGESPPSDADGKSPCKPLYRSLREVDVVGCWWKLLLVRVLEKFRNMVTRFCGCNFSSITGTLRSLCPVLAVATWWWMRVRAPRRRCKEDTVGHLRNVIKVKDEMIVQLLHQIAEMNEVLVKNHKNVVSRIPN